MSELPASYVLDHSQPHQEASEYPVTVYEVVLSPVNTRTPNEPHQTEVQSALPSDSKAFHRAKTLGRVPTFRVVQQLQFATSVSFNAQFESGNLHKAVQTGPAEYDLHVRSDTGASCNAQWFYFAATSPLKSTVCFNVVNMKKSDLLFANGMHPAVYSSRLRPEWHRDTFEVSYTNTNIANTLSFKYEFKEAHDIVYFAYSIPYTYTDLLKDIDASVAQSPNVLRVSTLCTTLGGNVCPLLTITEDVHSLQSADQEAHEWELSSVARKHLREKRVPDRHSRKHCIVVTSRVHSGETVSSFVMKGLMQFLTGESRQAQLLRKQFIFKLVPMLNPDGVRHGNDRASLLGVDLNRRWLNPNRVLHPTIYFAKKMLESMNDSHGVELFVDLHGHSRKEGVFMYGCSYKTRDPISKRKNLLTKLLPALMAKDCSHFSYKNSHFKMERGKESTARLTIFNQLHVVHSYTLEASSHGSAATSQMTEADLESVGATLGNICTGFIGATGYMDRAMAVHKWLREGQFPLKIQGDTHTSSESVSVADLCLQDGLWKYIDPTLLHSESTRLAPLKSFSEPSRTPKQAMPVRPTFANTGQRNLYMKRKLRLEESHLELKHAILYPHFSPTPLTQGRKSEKPVTECAEVITATQQAKPVNVVPSLHKVNFSRFTNQSPAQRTEAPPRRVLYFPQRNEDPLMSLRRFHFQPTFKQSLKRLTASQLT